MLFSCTRKLLQAKLGMSYYQGREFDLAIFWPAIFWPSIFKKDQRWSNRSRQSFKMIDRDRNALVDLLKWSTIRIALVNLWKRTKRSNQSFDHKKIKKTSYLIKKPMNEFPTMRIIIKDEGTEKKSILICPAGAKVDNWRNYIL